MQLESSVFHRRLADNPGIVVSAEGNYLNLQNGERILDGCGGAAVVSVGHARKEVAEAIADQAQTITYASSLAYTNSPAEELAKRLSRDSKMSRVVFYSGGTEALDSSLKLCRQYHLENGQPQRVHFIARERSYHGNSLSTLALSHHRARKAPYEPLFSDKFHHVSPAYAYRYQRDGETTEDYVRRLADELEQKIIDLGRDKVAAFYAETVVGATTGCVTAPPGYFKAIQQVCDRYGVLLVLDEIMCGMGRTGKQFAYQWEGVQPDIVVIGKGLAGGYVPLSAVLISSKVVDVFRAGTGAFINGHTFQSHILGCRAAVEVQKIIEKEQLIDRVREKGQVLERLLRQHLGEHAHVGDIRGRGLFWGIEFVADKASRACFADTVPLADLLVTECHCNGIAVYPGVKGTFDGFQGDHILIAPPYTINDDELLFIVKVIAKALDSVLATIRPGGL